MISLYIGNYYWILHPVNFLKKFISQGKIT